MSLLTPLYITVQLELRSETLVEPLRVRHGQPMVNRSFGIQLMVPLKSINPEALLGPDESERRRLGPSHAGFFRASVVADGDAAEVADILAPLLWVAERPLDVTHAADGGVDVPVAF